MSLRILKSLGAEEFLVAASAVFLSTLWNSSPLYTDYGDMITCA